MISKSRRALTRLAAEMAWARSPYERGGGSQLAAAVRPEGAGDDDPGDQIVDQNRWVEGDRGEQPAFDSRAADPRYEARNEGTIVCRVERIVAPQGSGVFGNDLFVFLSFVGHRFVPRLIAFGAGT